MGNERADRCTVAELLVRLLARAGVDTMFGVAGSTIMPLLDAVDGAGIRYVGARYELSAAEMASGYARATGRLGVVATHVGPGATSCVTALAGANRDGVPLLLITGNEESDTLARQPYHDWDLQGVMPSLTAFTYRLTRPDELPHALRRALTEAVRGAPRPVHLDLPEDLALTHVSDEDVATWTAEIAPTLATIADAPVAPIGRPAPAPRDVTSAVDLLAAADRPMMLVGEAIRWATDPAAVFDACERLGVPYATTFGARGGVGDRPGYVGTVGRFGSTETTALLGDADVVVALGAELTDVDTVRWRNPTRQARLVAVHVDAGKIDRRLPATLGVVADVEEFLAALVPAATDRGVAATGSWSERAATVDRTAGPVGDPSAGDDPPLDALLVARAIEAVPDDWVVACDPGFAPLSLSAPAEFGGSRFLYAFGLGAMGFAVPGLIGATQAQDVSGGLAVIGDGSLFMSLPSLESIASLDAPVVVIVVDDGGFGSQRKKQQEGYGRNVGVDYDNPDIAAIATAMGIEARWVTTRDEVDEFTRSLPGRTEGAVVVVRRPREQQGTWYEGSSRRR